MSTVADALNNLKLPEYHSVRAIFGKVLLKRSKQREPHCTLFRWLALRIPELQRLDEDCGVYIDEIGPEEVKRKCKRELLGSASLPFRDFNGVCADFWAEMAAIRVLRDKGYSEFRPIHKELPDGTTSDYEAHRGSEPVLIEVKNVRPNKTIFDKFDGEIRRLHEAQPSEYPFDVIVDYPYDDPPTGEQERRIVAFLKSIRGLTPPFHKELDLEEAVARVTVNHGAGRARMIRGIGPESPEPLNKQRFLLKIRAKAEEAHSQMKTVNRLKVLVINFDPPSGSISGDFVESAEDVMREVFSGGVDPYFLCYRHLGSL